MDFRSAKIVCTLGPASNSLEMIEKLMRAGMDVARLNFSHGDYAGHERMLKLVYEASERAGRAVGVLQDLCGPKIRMCELPDGKVTLERNQALELFCGPAAGTPKTALPVQYEGLARDVKPGNRILFDDGNLEAEVERIDGHSVHVRVVRGGILKSKKGLNLPGIAVSAPSVTPKDLEDLEWGLAHGVDFVALSFVRCAEDLEPVRKRVAKESDPPLIIAKLEKPESLDGIEGICAATDGLMVARGDLGVEMDFQRVPLVQKRLIRLANEHDLPVITATQMLESMTHSPRPTRAEASDVANAILDGTDAVMLSGETASGEYPVEAVEAMSRIAEEAEEALAGRPQGEDGVACQIHAGSVQDALAMGVQRIASTLDIQAIMVPSTSGKTARYMASNRPLAPIVSISPKARTVRRMTLFWGVTPVLGGPFDDAQHVLDESNRVARELSLGQKDEFLIVVEGKEQPGHFTGRIQLYRLH